jgi:outer membrane protein OmpA-like peptidoglycan-associated protein
MNKFIRVAAPGLVLGLLILPLAALAWGRVGVGVRIGGPVWYGPHYYYGPRYYYYPPYYYGPGWGYYYYPPPAAVYEPPPEAVDQAPPAYWYYCGSAKTYYPYVGSCPEGWQAVPAQTAAPPQQPQAKAQSAPPVPAPKGTVVYRLGDLMFASGQADLGPAATATLDTMLAALAKEPERRIVVEGHTDSSGDKVHNRELSQRRAEAVRQYLVGHGIAADRITAIGKGEAEPIAGNDSAEGRKRNRRVDVIVS